MSICSVVIFIMANVAFKKPKRRAYALFAIHEARDACNAMSRQRPPPVTTINRFADGTAKPPQGNTRPHCNNQPCSTRVLFSSLACGAAVRLFQLSQLITEYEEVRIAIWDAHLEVPYWPSIGRNLASYRCFALVSSGERGKPAC